MNKKRKKIIISAILIIVLLVLGGSYFIGSQIVTASTNLVTNEQTMEMYEQSWELEGFDYDKFSAKYQIDEKSMPSSFDEHTLPFDVISASGNENVVVMSHGMLGNRLTNYPTAEIFLENGYNVISYDQRSSGDNYAKLSTFGYWEKYDLIDCIDYAKENYPEAEIVVWGESFGGATAILAVAHEDVQKDISALILDCPVSSMTYMIEQSMREMNIPLPMEYLIFCGNFVNERKLGFGYEDADGITAIEKIQVPTLIFNSKADKITPEFMGKDLYDHLAADQKELYTSESSAHIEIRNHERDAYIEKILWICPD